MIPKPSSQMSGFDTIVEGDEVDHPVSTRGDASLYDGSPMVKLLEEYMTEVNGSSLSTEATVGLLVNMDELEAEHVVIVENRNKGTTKYKLVDSLLDDLSRTTVELQVFIEKASGFMDERTRHFTVDPKDTLLQILQGTTGLPQLNVAWKTMTGSYHLHHALLSCTTQNLDQLPGMNEMNFHSFMAPVSFRVPVNNFSFFLANASFFVSFLSLAT